MKMKIKNLLLSFSVLPIMLLTSCEADKIPEINEEGFQELSHIHGHKDEAESGFFEAKQGTIYLKYHFEPHGHHGPNSLKVFLSTGAEDLYRDPVIQVLNKSKDETIEIDNLEPDTYQLVIRSVHGEYDIEVFETVDD